jgi:hypothetical protein
MLQIQARSSFSSRSDRAFAESATTVGADIIKYILHAMATERAFVGANMRLC